MKTKKWYEFKLRETEIYYNKILEENKALKRYQTEIINKYKSLQKHFDDLYDKKLDNDDLKRQLEEVKKENEEFRNTYILPSEILEYIKAIKKANNAIQEEIEYLERYRLGRTENEINKDDDVDDEEDE